MTNQIKIGLIAILCCTMLSGCTTTVHVKNDLAFKPQPEKIQKTVALYISQDTQQFNRSGKHAGGRCIIQFGQSLEPNAESSLRQVFSKVVTLSSKDAQSLSSSGADYLIELQINDDTRVQVGAATFSAHTAIVSLKCIVIEPKDDTLLLEEDIRVEKEESPGTAGFVPCLFIHQRAWERTLQSAVDESMQEALEKVNNLLLNNRGKFK